MASSRFHSLFSLRVGDAFIHKIEALSQAKLSFWQRLKPSNQERFPYLIELLTDGTFVAGWMTPHVAGIVEDRVEMLRGLLEESPPASAHKHTL